MCWKLVVLLCVVLPERSGAHEVVVEQSFSVPDDLCGVLALCVFGFEWGVV